MNIIEKIKQIIENVKKRFNRNNVKLLGSSKYSKTLFPVENKKADLVIDSVDTLLNMDDKDFKMFLNTFGEFQYKEIIDEIKNGGDPTLNLAHFKEIMTELKRIPKGTLSEKQKSRIEELNKIRKLEDFREYIKIDESTKERAPVFEKYLNSLIGEKGIFENIEELKKSFINENGETDDKKLADLKKEMGDLSALLYTAELEFNIDEIDNMKEKIAELENLFKEYDEEMIKKIEQEKREQLQTKSFDFDRKDNKYVIEKDDEPDFVLDKKLKDRVLGNIPEDLTTEEKIVYAYMKFCQNIRYDDTAFNRRLEADYKVNGEHNDDSTYEQYISKSRGFNKEHLENITVGDKIICFDFSRILAKILNSLEDENVKIAVIGGKGHFKVKCITNNTSFEIEGTNTSDIFDAQVYNKFAGIVPIVDDDKIMENAVDRVCKLEKENSNETTINKYLKMLQTIREEEISEKENREEFSFENFMEAFVETLKEKELIGLEAMRMAWRVVPKIEDLNVYDIVARNDNYNSKLLFNKTGQTNEYYVFDTNNYEVERVTEEDLKAKQADGTYIIYTKENKEYKMLQFDNGIKIAGGVER